MQSIANKVSIPSEAPCICGSGKAFADCCMNKNHVYEALTVDKVGTTVIYDQTEIISAIKSLNSFIESRINSTTTRLAKEEALRKLKKLYEKLGNALSPMARAVSCREGCDHCCHLLVVTSELEIELIKDYISSNYSSNELQDLKERVKSHKELLSSIVLYSNGNFSEESTQTYMSSRVPCAFLDESSRCMIYEARPFICRKYLVFNSPEVCSNPFNKTDQYYSGYHSTVKDAIIKLNQLTYGSNYEYKHLLSWFIED